MIGLHHTDHVSQPASSCDLKKPHKDVSLWVSSQRSIISPYKLYYLLLRAGHALPSTKNDAQHNKNYPQRQPTSITRSASLTLNPNPSIRPSVYLQELISNTLFLLVSVITPVWLQVKCVNVQEVVVNRRVGVCWADGTSRFNCLLSNYTKSNNSILHRRNRRRSLQIHTANPEKKKSPVQRREKISVAFDRIGCRVFLRAVLMFTG